MSGLPWFELDVNFADDPKVVALASRLSEPLADAYVLRVYAYCYRHAIDRFDAQVAPDTIENAARWRGRRGVLFDALFAVEVLERDGQKVDVHGVKERLGPHLAKRVVDAERQKKHRKKVEESIGRNAGVTRDVTRDVTGESRGNKDKDIDKEATTHTLGGGARKAGAAAALAIVSDAPGSAPLADAVLKLLRASGKNAMHASAEARASVEDAIGGVTPETAAARVLAAWNPAKPWLTFYLDAIAGQTERPTKPPNPKAMAPVGQDWSAKPW